VPAVSEIVVTKSVDAASAALYRMSLWGEGKKATIVFAKAGQDGQYEAYLTVELENILISNFSVSGAGGGANGRPMESLSLNFTKITYSTTAYNKDTRTTLPQWDLATGRGS
jgi:type VI secretion system secreted protein Hcp